jgi:succinate dehydrogenase flavin-adding protein (antitoxin of CptAB toxin-antitoxin module)
MKELDLLLVRYLESRWARAGEGERAAFGRLLELPDPVLAAYLLGHEFPPPDLAAAVQHVRGL